MVDRVIHLDAAPIRLDGHALDFEEVVDVVSARAAGAGAAAVAGAGQGAAAQLQPVAEPIADAAGDRRVGPAGHRLFGTDGIRAPFGDYPLDRPTVTALAVELGASWRRAARSARAPRAVPRRRHPRLDAGALPLAGGGARRGRRRRDYSTRVIPPRASPVPGAQPPRRRRDRRLGQPQPLPRQRHQARRPRGFKWSAAAEAGPRGRPWRAAARQRRRGARARWRCRSTAAATRGLRGRLRRALVADAGAVTTTAGRPARRARWPACASPSTPPTAPPRPTPVRCSPRRAPP